MCESRCPDTSAADAGTTINPLTSFQLIYRAVQNHARVSLRYLTCADRKAEITAEATGLAWLWHVRLIQRGRDASQFPTALARFAVRAALSGRCVAGQESARDVLSGRAQRRHGIRLQPLPTYEHPADEFLIDALTDCPGSQVPDLAHVRLEFPRWLTRLSERNQCFVLRAVEGNTTTDLARMFQVSPARVSQLRRELAEGWNSFCQT